MTQHVSALLVYDESPLLDRLKCALNDRSLSAGRARTCQEAQHLIKATEPHLIFTDTQLPDGTWADVVRCGEKAEVATNVIVVSDSVDMGLYIKVMEAGAFDFYPGSLRGARPEPRGSLCAN